MQDRQEKDQKLLETWSKGDVLTRESEVFDTISCEVVGEERDWSRQTHVLASVELVSQPLVFLSLIASDVCGSFADVHLGVRGAVVAVVEKS